MRKGRRRFPELLSTLLDKALPASDSFREAQVFAAYLRATPKAIAANARPVRYHEGILFVHAKSSGWAQELDLQQRELLAQVRAELRGVPLRALRFRVGPLPDLPTLVAPPPLPPPAVPVASLPEPLSRALAGLRDDGLRDAIAGAAR